MEAFWHNITKSKELTLTAHVATEKKSGKGTRIPRFFNRTQTIPQPTTSQSRIGAIPATAERDEGCDECFCFSIHLPHVPFRAPLSYIFVYVWSILPAIVLGGLDNRALLRQVRRVRSTVHLTGKPSGKTKQRIIDLLAPARSEVVATTTAATATNSCSSSPVPSSSFDADALEACTRRAVASLRDFPGALRDGDEGVDKKSENFWEESGSTEGASERSTGRHGRGSSLGEREGSQAPRGRQSNFGDGDGFEVCVRIVEATMRAVES